MKITKSQKLILYALGHFYNQLNQPLAKPLKLRTSKIAFITFLLHSSLVTKQERALYKNLEILEKKKLISYENKMIKLSSNGLDIYEKINSEIEQFVLLKDFFKKDKPRRKLQTTITPQ